MKLTHVFTCKFCFEVYEDLRLRTKDRNELGVLAMAAIEKGNCFHV